MAHFAADKTPSGSLSGWLNGFLGVVIFSGSLPATRVAVLEMDPFFLTFARASIAGVLALMLIVGLREKRPQAAHILPLMIVALGAVKNIVGLSDEKDGLIYTRRGGFIDIAHVRDTADNTLYLFSRILPELGRSGRYFYSEELGVRRVQLQAFTPPSAMPQRYTLAAWLAGHLAFELAQWHEIAQWYGFQSVPGFSEEISAFSPEDLYSNLLGARLAVNVIVQGKAGSIEEYNAAMDVELRHALLQLGVTTLSETERKFRELDGDWWNSKRRVPDKFLVLKRNYNLDRNRLPTPVAYEKTAPYMLTLPQVVAGYQLSRLGELQIYPGASMQSLPPPATFYGPSQFQALADKAQEADKTQLERFQK